MSSHLAHFYSFTMGKGPSLDAVAKLVKPPAAAIKSARKLFIE